MVFRVFLILGIVVAIIAAGLLIKAVAGIFFELAITGLGGIEPDDKEDEEVIAN